MIESIFGLIAAALGLVLFFVKRKKAPTPEERIEDVIPEFSDTLKNVLRLRELGKNRDADEMLERIHSRSLIGTRQLQQHILKSTGTQLPPDDRR